MIIQTLVLCSAALLVIAHASELNSTRLESKLVGGHECTNNKCSFIVSVIAGNGLYLCVATLIEVRVAITDAVCVENIRKLKNPKYGGAYVVPESNNYELNPIDFIKSPDPIIDDSIPSNEIAVLILERDFHENTPISQVPLPAVDIVSKSKQFCEVVGWGAHPSSTSASSSCLKYFRARNVYMNHCKERNPDFKMFLGHFCGIAYKDDGYITEHDMGSPIICNDQFAGIATSYPSLPDGEHVYINIYRFVNNNFIKNAITEYNRNHKKACNTNGYRKPVNTKKNKGKHPQYTFGTVIEPPSSGMENLRIQKK